jgi:chloramphenicol-sensitive protein RarD
MHGSGAFGHSERLVDGLLVGSGLVTAIPLLLFAYAARRIALSAVGLLQYISPSLQLWCGIVFFREPFTGSRAAGFVLIWLALAIYALDGLWRSRPRAAPARGEAT